MNDFLLEITLIARQRGGCSPETESCILYNRLTGSYGVEEIGEMIEVITVTYGRFKYHIILFRPLFCAAVYFASYSFCISSCMLLEKVNSES